MMLNSCFQVAENTGSGAPQGTNWVDIGESSCKNEGCDEPARDTSSADSSGAAMSEETPTGQFLCKQL